MAKEQVTNELDFYDEMSGAGYDNMGGDKFVMPMLLVAQSHPPLLTMVQVKLGDFYNSVTKESYGPSVEVTVVYLSLSGRFGNRIWAALLVVYGLVQFP